MGDKSQVATEYLIIMGFIVVVLVPITLLYIRYSGESNDSVTSSKVEHITNEIAAAADSVYAYGEGSQTKLELDFPSNIKEIKFVGKEVIFTVINSKNQESEIVQVTDVVFDSNSDLYVMPGKKEIIVRSLGTSVSVTMPCEEDYELCCTNEQRNDLYAGVPNPILFHYGCYYKCTNKIWVLTSLCYDSESNGPCTQNGNQVECINPQNPDCQTEEICTSIYDISTNCGDPPSPNGLCEALRVCCPDESED